jgi:hypothetical protein
MRSAATSADKPDCLENPTRQPARSANVPDALHRRLKSRAALASMSLSDYLLNEIREVAERPTLDELRARLERRSSATLPVEPAEAVRAERDGREVRPIRRRSKFAMSRSPWFRPEVAPQLLWSR